MITQFIGWGAIGIVLAGAWAYDRDQEIGRRLLGKLAMAEPLTLDQALAGPPPRRGRRWGCAAPDLVDAQRRGWV